MTESDATLHRLYHELVVRHAVDPVGYGDLDQTMLISEGNNPTCGDHVRIGCSLDGDRIRNVAFDGEACAICRAAASVLCQHAAGAGRSEAREWASRFEAALREHHGNALPGWLEPLQGVRDYRTRWRCALLPLRTLAAALEAHPE